MRPRSRTFWFGLGALVTYGLVVGLVPAERARTDRVVLLCAVVYGCLLVRSAFGVGERPEAVAPVVRRTNELPPADEQDVRLARLDTSIRYALESGEHYAKTTRPLLRRIATERLHDKYGIDAAADPAGARRLLGEELWEIFATDPAAPVPAPAPEQLRVLVERVERL